MRTNDDIEAYLIQLNAHFEEAEDGMWVLSDENDNKVVIYHTPPVINFRVKLMDLPVVRRQELYERLLVLNSEEMLHGAYGVELEGENVVCVDSLQSENLDFNEFQASVEALLMAISSHYPVLKEYRDPPADKKGEEETNATEG